MKIRKTIYHLIVDKSGSMSDCIENTINGFNEQVNRIKHNELEFKPVSTFYNFLPLK